MFQEYLSICCETGERSPKTFFSDVYFRTEKSYAEKNMMTTIGYPHQKKRAQIM